MSEKKQPGLIFVDGKIVELEPHTESDCRRVCEEARQRVRGHETVYEAPDAAQTRASVGYSRDYARNYAQAFGGN